METIINKAKGSFVRLHGIFGITHKGTILFTEEAIIITNKKDIRQSQFSKEEAIDILYYSEIANFTCSLRTAKDFRYQITTNDGGKCNLILAIPLDFSVEELVGEKTTFYKNLIEKKIGVATKSESEIFAALCAKHISGLPIAEGVPVNIAANKERLLFIHNSQEISLTAEKITDISIKTDTEIQSSYVSSIGNALLGARLFGSTGAIIGGQAREKRSTIETYFLIVAYKKQAEQAYLSFQIDDIKTANTIISFFNSQSSTTPARIEL